MEFLTFCLFFSIIYFLLLPLYISLLGDLHCMNMLVIEGVCSNCTLLANRLANKLLNFIVYAFGRRLFSL